MDEDQEDVREECEGSHCPRCGCSISTGGVDPKVPMVTLMCPHCSCELWWGNLDIAVQFIMWNAAQGGIPPGVCRRTAAELIRIAGPEADGKGRPVSCVIDGGNEDLLQ